MINYELADSPFFAANKKFCEIIEIKLKSLNLDYSGFCNSYGYNIETTWKKSYLTYTLKFHKHQSTQNGVIIPVNAIDYAGAEVIVTGLNKKFRLTIDKSSFKRFFSSKKLNDKIPSPYFIRFNFIPDNNFIDELVKKILADKISKFKLSKGILLCKIHTPLEDPLVLLSDIEKTIARWT